MIPLLNNVLIKPDKNLKEVIRLQRNVWSYAMTGTVIGVPRHGATNHLHDFVKNLRKNRFHVPQLQRVREITAACLDTDTEIEVIPGDRVFFSYLCQNEEGLHLDDVRHLIVNYDALVCKEDLTPLNGYVILNMDEKEERFFRWADPNTYTSAKVVSTGSNPADWYGKSGDPKIKKDMRVFFNKGKCVRLEVNEFNTLNPGSHSSFFRIKWKDILAYEKST